MNNTIQYYNTHAADFTQDTQSTDMSEKYAPFLSRISSGGHILDLGCGAGRDTKAFLEMGY
ncbi:MAG: class I SAM-dependent methyltransferase, partial [Peptococcaceae bacterium]|nr:class I SAM-dependent methyltransferase [Peptococcaceae bacterium]